MRNAIKIVFLMLLLCSSLLANAGVTLLHCSHSGKTTIATDMPACDKNASENTVLYAADCMQLTHIQMPAPAVSNPDIRIPADIAHTFHWDCTAFIPGFVISAPFTVKSLPRPPDKIPPLISAPSLALLCTFII